MQFFLDSNGVIQASFPHPVNQGGHDAYNIALYAPFAAGTVITASFKLPNGEIKGVYQLTEVGAVNDVEIAGAPARLWRMAIPGEITQYYGTVTAQFFVSASGGTLPSSSTSFVVARGVPQVIDDTSPLDTITENIASLQSDLNNGYFSAKGLREWNALYTYGLGELVYVSEGDGNVLLESLKANNTDAPYTDGELNTASWKVALDKFVTPLSDDDPEMDGTASAGSAPEAARADHVHPSDTTKQDRTDNSLSTMAKTIVGAINENKTAIDGLQQDVINNDHFKGFAETSADVQEITGDANDFVYCIETGTIWTYGSSGWTDSNKPYPSDATPLATTAPLMDGTAAVGESSSAARADHVHPQDTVLAGKIEDIEDGTTPAGKVGHTLTLNVNGTETTFDGSEDKSVSVTSGGSGDGGTYYAHNIVIEYTGSSYTFMRCSFVIFNTDPTPIDTLSKVSQALANYTGGGFTGGVAASGYLSNIEAGTGGQYYDEGVIYNVQASYSTVRFNAYGNVGLQNNTTQTTKLAKNGFALDLSNAVTPQTMYDEVYPANSMGGSIVVPEL